MLTTRSKTRLKALAGVIAAVAVCSVNGTAPSASASALHKPPAAIACGHGTERPAAAVAATGCAG